MFAPKVSVSAETETNLIDALPSIEFYQNKQFAHKVAPTLSIQPDDDYNSQILFLIETIIFK